LRGSSGYGAEHSLQNLSVHVAATTTVPDRPAPYFSDAAPRAKDDTLLWVARIWLSGVTVLALRILFGLLALEQLRRRGLSPLPAALVARFRILQARVGITRVVEFCQCQSVRVPAVIGLFRPIVLIPVRALTGLSTEQLEAVVAHELGHIKRFDVAVNFLQTIAETLLFFHPAVWWLNKRIRADREDCCDDVAVSVSGASVGYARALASMATWRDAPNFAMAATGGPIAARVARLLGVRDRGAAERTAGVVTASLVLSAAVASAAVSFGLVNPAQASPVVAVFAQVAQPDMAPPPPPAPEVAPPSPPATVSVPTPAAAPAPAPRVRPAPAPKPPRPAKPSSPATPAAPATPAEMAEPSTSAEPGTSAEPATPAEPRTSFISSMKAAGYDNLDADQLIALRTQGVTPKYVSDMRAAGFKPTAHQLVGMAVHGVTPEYVQQMRSLGFKPDADQIIALKVQDISTDYVKGLRDLGIEPDTNQIIALRVQDVTPDYIRQMRANGLAANTDDLISMKVQDVTPQFRDDLKKLGFDVNVQTLIEAKVMDITPQFIEQARAHGFVKLDLHQLIQLKNADVF